MKFKEVTYSVPDILCEIDKVLKDDGFEITGGYDMATVYFKDDVEIVVNYNKVKLGLSK